MCDLPQSDYDFYNESQANKFPTNAKSLPAINQVATPSNNQAHVQNSLPIQNYPVRAERMDSYPYSTNPNPANLRQPRIADSFDDEDDDYDDELPSQGRNRLRGGGGIVPREPARLAINQAHFDNGKVQQDGEMGPNKALQQKEAVVSYPRSLAEPGVVTVSYELPRAAIDPKEDSVPVPVYNPAPVYNMATQTSPDSGSFSVGQLASAAVEPALRVASRVVKNSATARKDSAVTIKKITTEAKLNKKLKLRTGELQRAKKDMKNLVARGEKLKQQTGKAKGAAMRAQEQLAAEAAAKKKIENELTQKLGAAAAKIAESEQVIAQDKSEKLATDKKLQEAEQRVKAAQEARG